MKIKNMLQKFSCISFLLKPLCLLKFANKLLFHLLFLCFYSVVFYLVNFKTNSIVNFSKINILKILNFLTFDDVFCWIVPLNIDRFHYFYSHAFHLYSFIQSTLLMKEPSIIMKHSFSYKTLKPLIFSFRLPLLLFFIT